jgi:hypothetical protein
MNQTLKTVLLATPVASLLAIATTASAAPFSMEGPLRSLTPIDQTNLAAGVIMDCVGKKVFINPTTTAIKTPVGLLPQNLQTATGITVTGTVANLQDTTKFPNSGWNPVAPATAASQRAGFIGGTCIITGEDTNTKTLAGLGTYPIATSVLVEVAENVLVGVGQMSSTDKVTPTNASVLGVPVQLVPDQRMPTVKWRAGMYTPLLKTAAATPSGASYYAYSYSAQPNAVTGKPAVEYVRNAFGVGVDPSTIAQGDILSAAGYLGDDGTLYAHTIESTTGTLIDKTARPTIQRAQCLAVAGTMSFTIRGGCVLPNNAASAIVSLFAISGSGNATSGYPAYKIQDVACTRKLVADTQNPALGQYVAAVKSTTIPLGACPASIAAHLGTKADLVTPDVR